MGYKLLPEDTEFTRAFYGRLYFNMNISIKIVSDFGLDPEMLKMAPIKKLWNILMFLTN
jgi:hypothetical protein